MRVVVLLLTVASAAALLPAEKPARGMTDPPKVVKRVQPQYTEEARQLRVEGQVIMKAEVDENGRARNIRVTKSLGHGLTEKAIECLQQWEFRPALRDGSEPVVVTVQVEINFRLP